MSFRNDSLISVIMGAYNSEEFISQAIESILNQKYRNFEFLIIEDNSIDSTLSIIEDYARRDKRIRVIRNQKNMGLGYSLNLGMREAKGDFIARMDADDISLSNRFDCQVSFLKKNPDVVCVGTSAKRFGDIHGLSRLFNVCHVPESHDDIKAWLLLGTPMFHPSVMFNARLMREIGLNYNPDYRRAQDYELWSRLVFKGEMRNIDKPLHCYRYSKKMASVVASDEQQRRAGVLQSRMLTKLLGRTPTSQELEIHAKFLFKPHLSAKELDNIDNWLSYCISMAQDSQEFDVKSVSRVLLKRRRAIVRQNIASKSERIRYYYSKSGLCLKNPLSILYLMR